MRAFALRHFSGPPAGAGCRGIIVVLAVSLFCSGCTFYVFNGGGSLPKERAFAIHGHSPYSVMPESERSEATSFHQKIKWEDISEREVWVQGQLFTVKRYRTTEWWSLPILGYIPSRTAIVTKDSAGRNERLWDEEDIFAPGFPLGGLWQSMWHTVRSVDSGEEYLDAGIHGIGLLWCLAGCHYDIAYDAQSAERDRYNVRWGVHLILGAIAFGRVNSTHYAQVAWIPIPLWRSE